MGRAITQGISEVLLHLYRVARTAPAPEFKDAALAAVRERLPFEAAMWGSFVRAPQGALVHAVHLINLPARKMQDYEPVKHTDFLHFKCCANPGRTFVVCVPRWRRKIDPGLLAYIASHRLWNTMATVWIENELKVCTAISIYRDRPGPPFSETERRLMQALVPHLVEAWNVNAIQFVDRSSGVQNGRQRARAMIDREGMIFNAESGFASLMRAEFADWVGPYIPNDVLRPLTAAGGEPFRSDAILVSRLREIENGMFLIGARVLAGIDRLSPRELSAARSFAAGKTYKEIAHTLGVAPSTVRNQLQSVYAKLGVGSKIALARCLDEAG